MDQRYSSFHQQKEKINKEKNPKYYDTKLDHNSKSILGLKEEIPLGDEGFLSLDTKEKDWVREGGGRIWHGVWELNSSNELHLHLEEEEGDGVLAWVVAEVVDASFSSSHS